MGCAAANIDEKAGRGNMGLQNANRVLRFEVRPEDTGRDHGNRKEIVVDKSVIPENFPIHHDADNYIFANSLGKHCNNEHIRRALHYIEPNLTG